MKLAEARDEAKAAIDATNITELIAAAQSAIGASETDLEEVKAVLPRATVALSALATVLDVADPLMVDLTRLRSLVDPVRQMAVWSTEAAIDRSANFQNTSTQILAEVAHLQALASTAEPETHLETSRQAYASLEAELAEKRDALDTQIQTLQEAGEASAASEAELRAKYQELADEVDSFKAQYTTDFDTIKAGASAVSAELQSTTETTTAGWKTESNAKVDKVVSEARSEFDHAQQEIDRVLTERREAAQAALDAKLEEADGLLVKMEETRTEVMEIAEALGTGAQSAGWGEYATQQRKTALTFSVAATISFVAAAVFGAWLAISAAESDLSWQRVATKLGVVLALALLGGYLASQSSEHRTQEVVARKRHLDLLALPPFIANLDEGVQRDIRQKLAEQGFLTPEPMPIAKGPRKGLSEATLLELIKTLSKGG